MKDDLSVQILQTLTAEENYELHTNKSNNLGEMNKFL